MTGDRNARLRSARLSRGLCGDCGRRSPRKGYKTCYPCRQRQENNRLRRLAGVPSPIRGRCEWCGGFGHRESQCELKREGVRAVWVAGELVRLAVVALLVLAAACSVSGSSAPDAGTAGEVLVDCTAKCSPPACYGQGACVACDGPALCAPEDVACETATCAPDAGP